LEGYPRILTKSQLKWSRIDEHLPCVIVCEFGFTQMMVPINITPCDIIDGEFEYEVEAVLAHRERKLRGKKKGKKVAREYLVKWLSYSDENNTWEPEDNLENARERLQEYWVNHGVQPTPPVVQRVQRKRRRTR
jgi:hypothetical protein